MAGRCRRCSAEVPPGTNRCPACRAFQLERSDWGEDRERCLPDAEERIWSRLAALNAVSVLLAVTGLGLMIQVVPFFGIRALQLRVVGDLTLDRLIPPAGAILFAIGLGVGARAKGRSVLWGFLGLLGCIGFVLLHFMGKVCHGCREKASFRDRRCARCGAPL